jgi:hypothetical protein
MVEMAFGKLVDGTECLRLKVDNEKLAVGKEGAPIKDGIDECFVKRRLFGIRLYGKIGKLLYLARFKIKGEKILRIIAVALKNDLFSVIIKAIVGEIEVI